MYDEGTPAYFKIRSFKPPAERPKIDGGWGCTADPLVGFRTLPKKIW